MGGGGKKEDDDPAARKLHPVKMTDFRFVIRIRISNFTWVIICAGSAGYRAALPHAIMLSSNGLGTRNYEHFRFKIGKFKPQNENAQI